jgi:transglutaminase/protease-like cytokinesis protein 3
MYTSGRTVKSRAAKQDLGLTPVKATREARKLVQRIMPNAFATIESKLSYDFEANTATVVTTITFPADHEAAFTLWTNLAALPGAIGSGSRNSARMTVTRTA